MLRLVHLFGSSFRLVRLSARTHKPAQPIQCTTNTHTHTQQFCAKHWDPGHLLSVASDNEKFCTRKHIKINFFGQSFRRKNETEKENMEREREEEKRNTHTVPNLNCFVCARHNESQKIGKT